VLIWVACRKETGTLIWKTDRSLVADVTASGPGSAGGTLHVEGSFEAPGPVGAFKVFRDARRTPRGGTCTRGLDSASFAPVKGLG
jgi:hypothetical protein